MFKEVRFQNGEVREVAAALKSGTIPCLEVTYLKEFEIFSDRLRAFNIFQVPGILYDKTARDGVKEPEFEFRAAFTGQEDISTSENRMELMYIDVYFEAEPEESYDPVGEM